MEALMQYIWQFRLWPAHDMATTDGRHIVVLDPGIHNHDSGPDFFNSKLIIGGEVWVGNVEIHVRASDWNRHGHDKDSAYDSVVLHIVDVNDMEIKRSDGHVIPQLVMKCAPDFSQKYHEMVNNTFRELPCGNEISSVPSVYLQDWISALGFERLYAKADRIKEILSKHNNDWSEAIYITLARAMGFSTNSQPFEMLAMSTPLKHMLHYTDSQLSIEAMLFGQAGMLESITDSAAPYVQSLAQEYNFLKTKYSLKRSENIAWKMARMRPQNFPHRRIATLASYIAQNKIFSNALIEIKSEEEARNLLDITLTGYWSNHFSLNDEGNSYCTKAFSYSSCTVLIINVVVPVIFAYSLVTGDLKRQEFAVDLMHTLKSESNRIIEMFQRAGIPATDAFTSQALIQLKRDYCETRKCLFCRIGHKLLSQKAKRC